MTRLMVCGAVLALCGSAMAQDRPPPPPRGDPPPALRGPKVQEDRVPGMDGSFGEGRPERMGGGRVPPGALMAAIGKLRGEGAPEGLRLTREQEEQLKALRADVAPPRDREPGEDPQARRRKMAERTRDVQTRAFAILTPEQKDFVKAHVDSARKDADGKQAEMRLQRKLKERGANPPADPPSPPQARSREGDAPVPRERLRHIAELLGQLSPEEREQFLSRIERALEERVGARSDGPPEGARPRRARPDQPPPQGGESGQQPRRRRNPPG